MRKVKVEYRTPLEVKWLVWSLCFVLIFCAWQLTVARDRLDIQSKTIADLSEKVVGLKYVVADDVHEYYEMRDYAWKLEYKLRRQHGLHR